MIRALAIALLATLAMPAVAPAVQARATLADIENEVMCTVCGVPLDLAREAPAAQRERALIVALLAQGKSKEQVKRVLVATYGREVLALPRDRGFDRTVYLVPIAAALAAAVALAVVIRRARRRRAPAPRRAPPALPAADARRLDEDLARFDR